MFVRPARLVLAALAATTVAGTALAGTADATPTAPTTQTAATTATSYAKGRVVARGGLTARSMPTTASVSYGTFAQGKVITITCKIRGDAVDGNDLWYLVPSEGQVFVAARYVANVGAAPHYCTGAANEYLGRTTATLTKRTAPTTRAAAIGSIAAGTKISVVCKIEGQDVGGNLRWYYLQDGRYVAARYVTNLGAAPSYCD